MDLPVYRDPLFHAPSLRKMYKKSFFKLSCWKKKENPNNIPLSFFLCFGLHHLLSSRYMFHSLYRLLVSHSVRLLWTGASSELVCWNQLLLEIDFDESAETEPGARG